MKKPNFFVVGAPKCGTTALCQYLSSHPHIYISSCKEPHYFADEFKEFGINTWEDYTALFQDAHEKHFRVGEGSTHYLFSPTALGNIYRYDSNAKIIAMLRNPIDLVYSYHSQLIYNLEENEKNFEKAWHLQSARAKGQNIPALQKNPLVLQYKSLASLGSQVEKLLQIFPKEQIQFILFDDFKSSTKAIYESVISFLDLPSDHKTSFPRVNANRKHRFERIGRLIENPPQRLRSMVAATKKLLGTESLGIANTARNINLKKFEREPLTEAFRAELFRAFESDIQMLSLLLNRDLSHWRP
ncbi:MAG: sulfotransferase domain-containing protein [Limnothrix sp. RL_2_0]|nr:sulfotransferase domain-containing protein [Limnothrix sp. RL_2_0]